MRRILAGFLLLTLALNAFPLVLAEETKVYRDEIYTFRYPASWSLNTASNGDIVLGSPDGKNAVLTFALLSDLYAFTGDAAADAPMIERYISSYGGKNLALTGEYTLIESGVLKGFRATGTWRATSQDAVMLVLTGERHMVGFVLVGTGALALEQDFLSSVELLGKTPTESAAGFLRWENSRFALDYPSRYSTMEQSTGVVFINTAAASNIIMARVYTLDFDYSDALATQLAAAALPKSTKVEANAAMAAIGDKHTAVIKGNVSDGPMEFYVIGSGKTMMALMFTGEEACGFAEHVIQSTEIK